MGYKAKAREQVRRSDGASASIRLPVSLQLAHARPMCPDKTGTLVVFNNLFHFYHFITTTAKNLFLPNNKSAVLQLGWFTSYKKQENVSLQLRT